MTNKFHPFHMVSLSPWPIMVSTQMWVMVVQTICSLNMKMNKMFMMASVMVMVMMSTSWWSETLSESKTEGMHQPKVTKGLKMGMILFILSEVMFFLSFFWAYFHSGISPSVEIGQAWPPKQISSFNPVNVPLLNTLILISSGVSITWAHHSIIENNQKKASIALLVTCVLGVYFSSLQYMEYKQAEFMLSDASYGSIFFMATGFHGIHVLIGTSFLMVTLKSLNKKTISKSHHISFEMAAWYWHFVDVVWLFLYLSIYWWGK